MAPAAEAAATMAALGALNEGGVALGDGANGRPNESRQQGVLLIKRRMDTGHSSSRGCGYGGRRGRVSESARGARPTLHSGSVRAHPGRGSLCLRAHSGGRFDPRLHRCCYCCCCCCYYCCCCCHLPSKGCAEFEARQQQHHVFTAFTYYYYYIISGDDTSKLLLLLY